MFQWLGKFIANDLIQSEVAKVRGDLTDMVKRSFAQITGGQVLKSQAYTYLDGILAEGQSVSKDRLDAWWVDKRAQLKTWAGQ